MTSKRKKQIYDLLKSIETSDEAPIAVVNPDKYIQHNPQTQEGGEGLASLFKRLSKTSPRVNLVRVFSDGDYVFAHTEYEFSSSRVGFEVFRFEGDTTVEHWDNIQSRQGPNISGHSMTDGETDACDLDKTEFNRKIVGGFIDDILINRQLDKLNEYMEEDSYTEHNSRLEDGRPALFSALSTLNDNNEPLIEYIKLHRILAEGNFVLCVCEGYLEGIHASFYDLFRMDSGKIAEHWDTFEAVPPRSEWKNDNGKF